jgi:hypothetical protein
MDFNGDRRSDLLYRNAGTGQVYRIHMNGLAAGNGAVMHNEPDLAWSIVQTGDFNGDGATDLLWRNATTGQVYVMTVGFTGLPSGGAVVHTEPNPDWRIVAAPDLDGDGKADLLWRNIASGMVYAMLMDGAAITAQGVVHTEPDTNWKIVGVGDAFLLHKSSQLLWRNFATGVLYLMPIEHQGGGVFTKGGAVIYSEPDLAWQVAGLGDIDGDGRSDIVWRNATTGVVYAMLLEDSGVVEQGVVWTEPDLNWKIVAVSDYNGDGMADLLWRNEATGQVYMMLMNGMAITSGALVYNEPDTAWRVLGPRVFGAAAGVPQP